MVRLCCICKLQSGMIEDISFHRFPKDNELKNKWIANIGRRVSIKTSSVCSQHFEEKDIYYKVCGESVKRFLHPTAIPCINLQHHLNSENVLNDSDNLHLNNSMKSLGVLSDMTNQNVIDGSDVLSTATEENTEKCTNEMNSCSSDLEKTNSALECNVENMEHKVGSQSNNTKVIERKSLKRNSIESIEGAKRSCLPRYIGDLRREDFTSDRSWDIMQKFCQDYGRKRSTLNQKVKRLKAQLKNLKELLDHLKSLGLLSSEGSNALEISTSPAIFNIIKNILTKQHQYSPDLKEFASTLLFYSTAAYEYVRQNFMKSLPHPQTIRQWFSKLDFSPGINSLVIENLKKMIEEYCEKQRNLQFGLQVDEMSIKRMIEWDGKRFYGQVDLGLGNDETEEATYALVFMIVCLNGHFKTPIAYYLIKGLSAEARASIAKQILVCLYENGIANIRAITFDGASTNLAMISQLGANLKSESYEAFFEHPVSKEPIVSVPDPCHMIKLVRNTWAEHILTDHHGNLIEWRYLEKMVDILQRENLHPAVKIRQRHIDFQREKMKVKLAAQIFSNSVADGLLFLKQIFPNDFSNIDATATLCKIINDVFDLLNSKRKFGKYDTQECVTKDSVVQMNYKVQQFVDYIETLNIFEKGECVKKIPILNSKRRMGFWGLIVAMKSVMKLANYVF